MWNWEKSDWSLTLTEESILSVEQPGLSLWRLCRAALTVFCGGRLRIKGGCRQHSCSFHAQNRIPAHLRRGSRRGGGVWMQGNKTCLFDNDIKGDGSPLYLRRSTFEVSWRQWSGRPSFLLLRSGDDYQQLSVQISWNNCQCDMRIIISPFSPADA